MLSNGNYAQYFPQALASPFIGMGLPQMQPQMQMSPPGAYGAGFGFGGAGLGGGFGQEFSYPGFGQGFGRFQGFGQQFGQQSPLNSPLAAFGSHLNQSSGSPLALVLSQLANQVVAQGAVAQQVGALLGQLAQQIVAQTLYGSGNTANLYGNANLYGSTANIPGGLHGGGFASPFHGNQGINPQLGWAFNPLSPQYAMQGRPGQAGNGFGGLVGNPQFGNPQFGSPNPQFGSPTFGGQVGGQGIGSVNPSPYFETTPGGYGGFAPQMQTPQSQAWAINRPAGTA